MEVIIVKKKILCPILTVIAWAITIVLLVSFIGFMWIYGVMRSMIRMLVYLLLFPVFIRKRIGFKDFVRFPVVRFRVGDEDFHMTIW